MVRQKQYFYWFLLSCVILTAFSGCPASTPLPIPTPPPTPTLSVAKESRPIPVTKEIINRVKEEDQKKPKDFQYYISKGITLSLAKSKEQFTIESGELVITKRTRREQITIIENLPGLIYTDVTATDDKGYLLEVHFEEKYPDCFIKFRQSLPGDDENYYLFYDDVQNKAIKYGDDNYTVTINGIDPIDPPYLLVKMKSNDISDSDARMASGVKLP